VLGLHRGYAQCRKLYWPGISGGRRNGAGVRIENLELFVPVKSGHTLTFSHEIVEKPDKIIRDKWGIIRSRNEAFNHRG
jgi:acyl dehydratase